MRGHYYNFFSFHFLHGRKVMGELHPSGTKKKIYTWRDTCTSTIFHLHPITKSLAPHAFVIFFVCPTLLKFPQQLLTGHLEVSMKTSETTPCCSSSALLQLGLCWSLLNLSCKLSNLICIQIVPAWTKLN